MSTGWVPCSEWNGPEKQEIVLVTVPAHVGKDGEVYDDAVCCAYPIHLPKTGTMWMRSDGNAYGELGQLEPDPVAWMPLPEPYRAALEPHKTHEEEPA